MQNRPTELSDEEQAEFDAHLRDLKNRLLDHVKPVLEEIPSGELRQLTYDLAFSPNDVLPKRPNRPHLLSAHLAEQVYEAYASEDRHRAPLLQFAITVAEYYDMLDDVVDGDVREGDEETVVGVTQLLMPIFVRRLAEIGTEAVEYWTEGALRLAESPYLETESEKTFDNYRTVLRKQASFFGCSTGVAAIAAGHPEAVDRAETVGRVGYRYSQVVLDVDQTDTDDRSDWNAAHLGSESEVVEYLEDCVRELEAAIEPFPDEQSHRIRATFSVDPAAFVPNSE